MNRAEYILGKKLFHHKFTQNNNFFHGVQTNYDIYTHSKKSKYNVR